MLKRNGESTEPCGIPQRNGRGLDLLPPVNTEWNWPLRKKSNQCNIAPPSPKSHNWAKRIPWLISLKATKRSRKSRIDALLHLLSQKIIDKYGLFLSCNLTERSLDSLFHPEPSGAVTQPFSLPSSLVKETEKLDRGCPINGVSWGRPQPPSRVLGRPHTLQQSQYATAPKLQSWKVSLTRRDSMVAIDKATLCKTSIASCQGWLVTHLYSQFGNRNEGRGEGWCLECIRNWKGTEERMWAVCSLRRS